jgi:hypothetical protein
MKKLTPSLLLCSFLFLLYSCQEEDSLVPVQGDVVLIKAAVKIEVGGIIYENLDATIKVNGYSATNTIQWTKDYNFIGPEDTLEVQNGFHHYSIELVNKWGINDIQSEIPAKEIWDGRADGPLPVTYVLAGSKEAKKLSKYVLFREVEVQGIGIVSRPESRILYSYDGEGRLRSTQYEPYNNITSQFDEETTQTFNYEGAALKKIVVTVNGKLARDYEYWYGEENRIRETSHFNNGAWSQTTTKLSYADERVSVTYSFSNGGSFLYEFDNHYGNPVADKTTKNTELCYKGNYTFDKNINPFRHLGYMDFGFQNWDRNNVITENVNYDACSFPVLIPVLHVYTYDEDGYPVKSIATYKPGSFESENAPDLPYHTEIDFYYE